jgi:hypothetical protein
VERSDIKASCLLDRQPERITPAQQDPRLRARFSLVVAEKEKAIGVIDAERNAKAERWTKAVLVSS